MNYAIYRLSLDMHCDSSGVTLHVKRRDTARLLLVTLTDGGVPYSIPQGCFAMLTARSPEGLLAPVECTVSEDRILCPIGAALTAVAGETHCELRVYDQPVNGEAMLLTSPRFTLSVAQPVQDDSQEEEMLRPSQNALDALVGQGLAVVEQAGQMYRQLQEAFDSGAFHGKDGIDGKDGKDGKDGADGHTPVKGVDYYTPEEAAAFLEALQQRQEQLFEATALWQEAQGENSIFIPDCAYYPLKQLRLFGKGTGSDRVQLYIPGLLDTVTVVRNPSNVTATEGSNVQFSVIVGGPVSQYQWQYSLDLGESWFNSSSAFPGYNTDRMTVAVTAARNRFMYRCRITDTTGKNTYSEPAQLLVGEETVYGAPHWVTETAVLTVQLPQPLSGTEAENGNCTDSEGRTWQSDLLDLSAGTFTPWGGAPVPLDADTSLLKGHRGAFRLYCSSEAHLEMTYLSDTKSYIDRKLEEWKHGDQNG